MDISKSRVVWQEGEKWSWGVFPIIRAGGGFESAEAAVAAAESQGFTVIEVLSTEEQLHRAGRPPLNPAPEVDPNAAPPRQIALDEAETLRIRIQRNDGSFVTFEGILAGAEVRALFPRWGSEGEVEMIGHLYFRVTGEAHAIRFGAFVSPEDVDQGPHGNS